MPKSIRLYAVYDQHEYLLYFKDTQMSSYSGQVFQYAARAIFMIYCIPKCSVAILGEQNHLRYHLVYAEQFNSALDSTLYGHINDGKMKGNNLSKCYCNAEATLFCSAGLEVGLLASSI